MPSPTRCRPWSFFSLLSSPLLLAALSPAFVSAQSFSDWDVTLARGETREIDFTTEEGTWMSVDISPDGQWIVFDLLAHVYRVPAAGGNAESLTQESGVALNYHPQYSPDGTHIAFISDRGGQNNLWVMNADGSNPRAVFEDLDLRATHPVWMPDGNYIVVRRQSVRPGGGGDGGSGLYMYHIDGGEGIQLGEDELDDAEWPSLTADGVFLYYQERTPGQDVFWTVRDILQGSYNISRFEIETGRVTKVTSGEPSRQYRLSSGGAYAGEVSPDGRWLAFARRIPDGTIEWKGHQFGPRSALWLRDLATGAERVVMDPIEQDMAEGMKTLQVLPGYSWDAAGESIVLSQGGKLRRLWVESGEVETIPISVRVQRTISEQAYRPFRISDDPFRVRFTRYHAGSPSNGMIAFQGAGKIYLMNTPNGTPRRLTGDDFADLEYTPGWSPDGRSIVFASVDEAGAGHLWTVSASGGTPERLTTEYGEYMHPTWSPDGSTIVAVRGAGATARTRTMAHNPYFDIVRLPATGGEAEPVIRVPGPTLSTRTQFVRPSFGPDNRIYYPQMGEGRSDSTKLMSVRMDGSDLRTHLVLPHADEVVVSPNGEWVAFNEGDNIYTVHLPLQGRSADPLVVDKRNGRGSVPIRKLSTEGGIHPSWRDANTVQFGSGVYYYAHHMDAETTDTVAIDLRIARDLAGSSIAITGARVITMNDRQVLENATLVARDGRITCVGQCDATGVERTIDATGKTIIPGFIDMHSHFFREHRGIIPSKAFETAVPLAYGVTTNLDNSMWSQDVFPAAEMIEAGRMIGPRTYSTGDPLYSGDRARQNELTSYEITEENIDRLQSWGAVSLKQYMQPRRAQRQWVSEAARRKGLMVTAEGSDLAYNLSMIMDGQTAFEHPMSYMPMYSDAARFFGQARAVYSPTFVVGGPSAWNDEYFLAESEIWKDEKLRLWMPWQQLVPHSRRRVLRPETDYSYPILAQVLADIMAEGGHGAIGAHGQQHGLASHWEVWMAASAMGEMGALELATKEGAYFLGAEQDVGSLSVGKLADLIVLNANPLDNIRNTTDIQFVMKGGRLYDGMTLDEVWPRQRPYGDRPWINPDAWKSGPIGVDHWDRVTVPTGGGQQGTGRQ